MRAPRWRGMLESKLFASVRDLAKAEKINEAYLGRVVRLTLLSPKITEAILSGRQREELDVAELLKPFPLEWDKQEALFSEVRTRAPVSSRSNSSIECYGTEQSMSHRLIGTAWCSTIRCEAAGKVQAFVARFRIRKSRFQNGAKRCATVMHG